MEVRLDAEDVTPVSVQDRSPPRRARSVMTGCEARGKAQGRLLRPGATGEGKTGRVNTSEPPRMPRYGNSPRRVVLAGMIRSGPLRIGRRRPRTVRRSCGHRCSRGTGGTRPGRISCVWNAETLSGPSRPRRCGGQLLRHVPPPGAPLHREVRVLPGEPARQPGRAPLSPLSKPKRLAPCCSACHSPRPGLSQTGGKDATAATSCQPD